MTLAAGSFSNSSTCTTSIRLASRVSGTTSVAPAWVSSERPTSSWVRTNTGTSARSRRTLRTMPTDTAGLAKVTITALATSTPTCRNRSSSALSPYTTASPACRAKRIRAGSRSSARYSKPSDSSTRAIFWPTRPKPHNTTCSRRASAVSAADSRSRALAGGPRSPSSSRAIRRL
jgi:hypothetical protein